MKLFSTLRYYAQKFGAYNISTYAASASFFIITAIFPLLMLVFSIVSMVPVEIQASFQLIGKLIPTSFQPLLDYLTEAVGAGGTASLSVSIVAILWTSSKSVLGLLNGLNAIADVKDTRNFVFKRILCIIYMLALITLLLINLMFHVFGQFLLHYIGKYLPHLSVLFSQLMEFRGITLFLLLALTFALIYTVFPNKKMRFYLQIPGALFTSFSWILFSELFSIYVDHASGISILYGSLGTVVLAMLWLYFCMSLIFIGAVINRLYPSIFWRMYVVFKHRYVNWKSSRSKKQ